MSSFTTPAELRILDNYRWELFSPFIYYTHLLDKNKTTAIVVPVGTITDLASVPRILWAVFPPHGRYAKASIVHDYLYQNKMFTRKTADLIFLEAMRVLNVPRWRAVLMYGAVRLFGRGKYV